MHHERIDSIKKTLTTILAVILLFSLAGCESATAGFADNSEYPAFPGLEWGVSREAAYKCLSITEKEVESVAAVVENGKEVRPPATAVHRIKVGGETVSLLLNFSTEEQNKNIGFDMGLVSVQLMTYDTESTEKIIAALDNGNYKKGGAVFGFAWDPLQTPKESAEAAGCLDELYGLIADLYKEELASVTADKASSAAPESKISKEMFLEKNLQGQRNCVIMTKIQGQPLTMGDRFKLLAGEEYNAIFNYRGSLAIMLNHVSKQK